jgi:hypothetical protein
VLVTFLAYVAGSVRGMMHLEPIVDYRLLVPDNDVYIEYVEASEKHFLEYPPPVQVRSLQVQFYIK